MISNKTKDAEQRVWDAYLAYLRAVGVKPGAGLKVTEAFRAGYMAAERALEEQALLVAKATAELDRERGS